MNDEDKEINEAFLQGLRSEPASHDAFRRARTASPNDVRARAKLFGAIMKQRVANRPSDETVHEGLWWIEHHPDLQFTGTVCQQFAHAPFPIYTKVRSAWETVLARSTGSAAVFQNAGQCFQVQEPERAEELWQQAHRLAPGDHQPALNLALLRYHRAHRYHQDGPATLDPVGAKDALTWFETALSRTTTDEQREPIFLWACDAAIGAGELDRAKEFGHELLRIASLGEPSKKSGSALFTGHTTLGRVALARDDIDDARLHLLEAGKTPGSASLDSFGPDFTLADALLGRGERQAVLTFLEDCAKFWKMDRGKLTAWRAQIETGGLPVLRRHG
jgi:hypothetical protein